MIIRKKSLTVSLNAQPDLQSKVVLARWIFFWDVLIRQFQFMTKPIHQLWYQYCVVSDKKKGAASLQNQQNGICTQRRLRSAWASADKADTQADLSLRWAHMQFCWFCREAAQKPLSYLCQGKRPVRHSSQTVSKQAWTDCQPNNHWSDNAARKIWFGNTKVRKNDREWWHRSGLFSVFLISEINSLSTFSKVLTWFAFIRNLLLVVITTSHQMYYLRLPVLHHRTY